MNKSALIACCIAHVDNVISDLQIQMQELIADASNDSKSTAGDKHETGRAMMQLAREQLGKQLQEIEIKRHLLARIDPAAPSDRASEGSLITTNENTLFIAAPLGKIQFDANDVFVISAQSPLGKLLMGKSSGETVIFNQRHIKILSIV